MPEMMNAFVMPEVGKTAVTQKPVPEPGPEEAIVRTTAALICTSDVHTVKGALPVPDGRTLGHESVGVIHKLGSAVTGFEEGQRLRDHAAVVDHDEGTLAAARRALPRARSAPPRREV